MRARKKCSQLQLAFGKVGEERSQQDVARLVEDVGRYGEHVGPVHIEAEIEGLVILVNDVHDISPG